MQASIAESRQLHEAKAAIGVDELGTYLRTFGYLMKDSNDKQQQQQLLESALKMYQKTYHLNVTGKLNSETKELINTPRRGLPDHNLINGSVQMGSYQAFFNLGPTKWPPTMYHLPYRISARDETPIGNDALAQACAQAFGLWAGVSNFTFTSVGLDAPHQLDISFRRGQHRHGKPFDGILRHAFYPMAGLMHLDADENWSLTWPKYDQYDLVEYTSTLCCSST
ncbi:metalloendoproteinase 5-MMP [Rosa chinensis]|nr:metalloendoproteinase 5-MMP [Rosa chinensis]